MGLEYLLHAHSLRGKIVQPTAHLAAELLDDHAQEGDSWGPTGALPASKIDTNHRYSLHKTMRHPRAGGRTGSKVSSEVGSREP